MSTQGSNRWSRILNRVEGKLEEIADAEGKVVTIPTSLDALAKEIRETTNAMVSCEAEFEKLARHLASQQRRMVQHMRDLGIRAEVVTDRAVEQEPSP